MAITARTKVVALLGHPVGHSVSPQLHNAAFAAAGLDAVYVAFDVGEQDVDDAIVAIERLGLVGANVTVPHKRAVFHSVHRRTPDAEASGAANTVFRDAEGLAVDNTDIAGLTEVLRDDVALQTGDVVVLLGTGGAARAAAVALGRLGARVHVLGRRPEAIGDIRAVLERHGGFALDSGADARVVINATPLGLKGERLPDDLMNLGAEQVALDLVYGSRDTPFLAAARNAGALALDGRGMLVAQAAAAFERWTGVAAPVDVMRTAVQTALADRSTSGT